MFTWICFTVIWLLLYLVEFIEPPWMKPISRTVFVAFTIIVMGFRDTIGWDYDSYKGLFYLVEWNKYIFIYEPSFIALIETLKFLGFDYQTLFLSYAILTYTILFISIKKYHIEPTFAMIIFVFLYFWAFANVIRQFLAVVIFLYGARYIVTREYKKFILSILIASMMHFSAIILTGTYIFAHKYYSKKVHLAIIGLTVFCLFTDIVPKIAEIILSNFRGYSLYIEYITGAWSEKDVLSESVYLMKFLFCLILILLRFNKQQNPYENLIYNMLVLWMASSLLLSFSKPLYRFSLYFEMFLPMAIVLYLSKVMSIYLPTKKWHVSRIMLRNIIVFCFAILFLIATYRVPFKVERVSHIPAHGNNEYKFNFNIFK